MKKSDANENMSKFNEKMYYFQRSVLLKENVKIVKYFSFCTHFLSIPVFRLVHEKPENPLTFTLAKKER